MTDGALPPGATGSNAFEVSCTSSIITSLQNSLQCLQAKEI